VQRTRQDYSTETAENRKQRVEQIYIIYPRNQDILNKFTYCHQHARIAAEPEGLLLEGPAGMGKTTLCKYYMSNFPRTITKDGSNIPILVAKVEVPASPKSLVTALLKSIGDPMPDKGSTVSQTIRLKQLMKDCGTQLVILDEFQHFIDRDSQKVLKTISDWLKLLMDDTRVPIILIGMPYSHGILDAEGNEQLQRRFSVRISLQPFDWTDTEDRKDFRKFLQAVDVKLPLNEGSNLSDTIMANRIYIATDGIVSRVMKLVRRATGIALDLLRERLDLDILGTAYEDCLAASNPEKENPFVDDLSSALKRTRRTAKSAVKATNNRSKAKEKRLKASDILS
jgi:hypothetical protein